MTNLVNLSHFKDMTDLYEPNKTFRHDQLAKKEKFSTH